MEEKKSIMIDLLSKLQNPANLTLSVNINKATIHVTACALLYVFGMSCHFSSFESLKSDCKILFFAHFENMLYAVCYVRFDYIL